MTGVAVIELLLFVNMVLFMVVFSLLAQPPTLVQFLLARFQTCHEQVPPEFLEQIVRRMLRLFGMLGCTVVFGWGMLTAFVITLFKGGYFWRN